MTLMLLLFAVALITVATLLWVARGQARSVADADQLLQALKAVDVEAFRNLTDAAEERYLQARLTRRDYRRVQRGRLLAAAEYVRRTAHNAAVLLRVGEAARRSPDREVARAAEELASAALELRINSLLALALLYARCLAPEARIGLARQWASYERMRANAVAFTRLEMPRMTSRIEAAL